MGERDRVRRVALLAGTLVALTALPVSEAAAADIVVRAVAGIGQVARPDRWMPVIINLDNSAAPFNGELLVSWGDVRVRRLLALPSAGRHRFELYLRTGEPEGTVRVRLRSGAQELQALDVPVRVVPVSDSVTLCVAAANVSRRDGCINTSADSLPRSPRAYDAVDGIEAADAIDDLAPEQRNALWQSIAIRAVDQSGDSGLVDRPSRPEQRRGLPRGVMQAAGVLIPLFVLLFTGAGLRLARRRADARWLWLTATAIVLAATVAAQAIGTFGPGASITVYHRTLVEQVLGADVSVLSMRGLAEFPAYEAFVLRLPVADGTIEPSSSGNEPAEQLIDESGQPVLAGVFGLGSRKAFSAEAITSSQPLAVSRHGNTWTVTNRSSLTFDQCRFHEGFSSATALSLPPGHTLEAQETGEVSGPAFTCETGDAVLSLSSPDRAVDMRGATVIAVYKSRQVIPPAGNR